MRRWRRRPGRPVKRLPLKKLDIHLCPTCNSRIYPQKWDAHTKACGKDNPIARALALQTRIPDAELTPELIPKRRKKKSATPSTPAPHSKKAVARKKLREAREAQKARVKRWLARKWHHRDAWGVAFWTQRTFDDYDNDDRPRRSTKTSNRNP